MKFFIKILFLTFSLFIQLFADSTSSANSVSFLGIIEKSGYFYEYTGGRSADDLFSSILLYSKNERKIIDFKDTLNIKTEEILLFQLFWGFTFIKNSDFIEKTGIELPKFNDEDVFYIGAERILSEEKSGNYIFKKHLVKDVPLLIFQVPFSKLIRILNRDDIVINARANLVRIGVILPQKSEIARFMLKKN